jgi:predicted metal-dependent hydrolase
LNRTTTNARPAAAMRIGAHPTHLDTDQVQVLMLDGQPIEYVLRRSLRRRRAMLSLHERGLVLAVPVRMSARAIATFVEHSLPWLRRHLPRWRAVSAEDAELAELRTLLLLGERLPVEPVERPDAPRTPAVAHESGAIRVLARNMSGSDALRSALRGWLQAQALPWYAGRAAWYAPVLGVRVPVLRLSNARTLWGSCTAAGLVRVNWRLLQAPPHLIDYVVVHELAHLLEPNHSARFWAVVARACPEHRAARSELSQWQRRLAAL